MQETTAHGSGVAHASLSGYITGFVLSIILTAIPFALVMEGGLPRDTMVWGIVLAAIVQILVHLHYFLHLDTSFEERWNVMALVFTIFIIGIFLGGTLWIMYNLNIRMMGKGAMHRPPPVAAMTSMRMQAKQ